MVFFQNLQKIEFPGKITLKCQKSKNSKNVLYWDAKKFKNFQKKSKFKGTTLRIFQKFQKIKFPGKMSLKCQNPKKNKISIFLGKFDFLYILTVITPGGVPTLE